LSYPITVEVDYVEKRSRLTTFFRPILSIPLVIVLYVYGIGAFFAVIIAWFAELFTGRAPDGIYDFLSGFLRFYGRTYGYAYLLTDQYAPFGLDDDAAYPVRVHVAPQPADGFSRLKVLLRIFYIIPAAVIAYVILLLYYLAAIGAWLVILITGKQPEGLQNTLRFCLTYITRVYGLFYLVTETYPPFSDEPGPSAPPTAPAAPAAAPAAPEEPPTQE
jgi:hypothetical protein